MIRKPAVGEIELSVCKTHPSSLQKLSVGLSTHKHKWKLALQRVWTKIPLQIQWTTTNHYKRFLKSSGKTRKEGFDKKLAMQLVFI